MRNAAPLMDPTSNFGAAPAIPASANTANKAFIPDEGMQSGPPLSSGLLCDAIVRLLPRPGSDGLKSATLAAPTARLRRKYVER
jgi:hypothetical protein